MRLELTRPVLPQLALPGNVGTLVTGIAGQDEVGRRGYQSDNFGGALERITCCNTGRGLAVSP